MTVVDVHTHMLSERWIELLREHGGRYTLATVPGGQRAVHVSGAPFMTLTPGMLDYDLRIRRMDQAGVDLAIVSLTCPNVFWGEADTSLEAARATNDDMAAAQRAWPDRIRWLASLPWQHPKLALAELDRALDAGAVGVMVLGNLTLAIARMVMDGFFDRFPGVRLIASHGGGTLPYLAGRLDQWHRSFEACRERIDRAPSEYLHNLWYDAVVYERAALDLLVGFAGPDRVLYGSDYPHNVGDMAGCLARVDSLPGQAVTAIRGANAERLFKL
jgi:aminocarboxymuconate-semialdehyde decarboxylase